MSQVFGNHLMYVGTEGLRSTDILDTLTLAEIERAVAGLYDLLPTQPLLFVNPYPAGTAMAQAFYAEFNRGECKVIDRGELYIDKASLEPQELAALNTPELLAALAPPDDDATKALPYWRRFERRRRPR